MDAADEEAMADLLRCREGDGLPPVAGVVHSAAVLEPDAVADLTEQALGGSRCGRTPRRLARSWC
ncbi:KR domain-containing protein [Streptomyces spectabilis]|uniref:Ketoreductase (KR) domain-containing protein n=1 Tax=Streptomyces spectabilis TaxID=68270 RepID=A0A7W8B3I9_STRST|nr:KR domain-containing protein [Streptomyces spectabilis]MBB5109668.1 hypothetical protein [Streptomyces spectabilis]